MKNILEVKKLSKTFGEVKAVDNISFEVEAGSFTAFLGQNGAGKSTTINILIGLLKEDSGSLCYSGSKNNLDLKNQIGVVFQSNMFDDYLTVKENLQLYGMFYLPNKNIMQKRYLEIINLFGLSEVENKRFSTLSGGQKRKAEMARALFSAPKILFLDEPTTGLDPKTRIEVWDILHNVRKSNGMTIFLTTHYMEETTEADKIIIIHKGKKVCEGNPTELKTKYTSDKLFIVPKDDLQFEKIFKSKNLSYEKIANNYIILINDVIESINILNELKEQILFYEVKKGSMDDVFLSVVGTMIGKDL